MENDLNALIERVKELRAQLAACGPEEKEQIMELMGEMEGVYDLMLIKSVRNGDVN